MSTSGKRVAIQCIVIWHGVHTNFWIETGAPTYSMLLHIIFMIFVTTVQIIQEPLKWYEKQTNNVIVLVLLLYFTGGKNDNNQGCLPVHVHTKRTHPCERHGIVSLPYLSELQFDFKHLCEIYLSTPMRPLPPHKGGTRIFQLIYTSMTVKTSKTCRQNEGISPDRKANGG